MEHGDKVYNVAIPEEAIDWMYAVLVLSGEDAKTIPDSDLAVMVTIAESLEVIAMMGFCPDEERIRKMDEMQELFEKREQGKR